MTPVLEQATLERPQPAMLRLVAVVAGTRWVGTPPRREHASLGELRSVLMDSVLKDSDRLWVDGNRAKRPRRNNVGVP